MATLTIPNTLVDGATIEAAPHNANNAAIAAVVNNLTSANYADGSVTEAKLATGLSPANFQAVGAFRVQLSADQSISAGSTYEKVLFDSEDFDVSSYYDNAANYRFTPTTAGIYLVSMGAEIVHPTDTSDSVRLIAIYKNGTGGTKVAEAQITHSSPTKPTPLHVSSLISMNGSTDYVEGYFQSSNTVGDNDEIDGGNNRTYLQAHLVGTT